MRTTPNRRFAADDRASEFSCRRHSRRASCSACPRHRSRLEPFTQAEFSAAQKDGKPILVDIFAPWCPTCRAQKPILEELTAKPEFKDLVVLVVDFDHQTDDVRALKAQQQSTLIASWARRGNRPHGRRDQSRQHRSASEERALGAGHEPRHSRPRHSSAGALSVLSPCVRCRFCRSCLAAPRASTVSRRRALAAGLSLFPSVVIGLFVATVGFAAGLDTGFFRLGRRSSSSPSAHCFWCRGLAPQAAAAGGPVSNWVEGQFEDLPHKGSVVSSCSACCLGAVWESLRRADA